MARPIDVEDKPDLAKVAEEVNQRVDHAVLRKDGQDVAVVLSTETYQRLAQEWEADFCVFDRIGKAMQGADSGILERDIMQAVEEVKALKRRQASNA